ncbi:glycoside hydrolase family 55 protein, partial [Tulasnella calospora MUT 4182]
IEASGPPQEFPDLAASTLLIHGKRYKKHERHWYEEGNFGFLVGDIAFRLHRSILSRRSSVISDLFSTPQPLFPIPELPSSGDNLIGVPFMELEDRAEDFAHILDFIYPNSLPVVQTRHLGVKNLMGIVRFTRKYLINDLKEWAISTLDSHLLPHASRGQSSPLKALLDKPSLYADPKFCIDIVHFSGECSLPKFLPLAFYALATAEWDQILGGASCLDQLSAQDRTRVHEGRLALSKAVLEKIPSLFEKLSSREGCTEDGCNSTKSLEPSTRWKGLMLHPLEELESLKVGWPFRTRFCVDCQKLVNQTQTIRDELKGRLTEFFKLEPKVAVANGSPGYDR